jgi:hypothetical protein
LKEASLDRTMWRNRFGRGFGTVVRQNTEWMNGELQECWNKVLLFLRLFHELDKSFKAAPVFTFVKTKPVTVGKKAKRGAVGVCGEEKHVSASVLMRRSDIAMSSVSLYRIMFIVP